MDMTEGVKVGQKQVYTDIVSREGIGGQILRLSGNEGERYSDGT